MVVKTEKGLKKYSLNHRQKNFYNYKFYATLFIDMNGSLRSVVLK